MEKKLSIEYQELSIDDEIHGSVYSRFFPKEWRGHQITQFVTLDNDEKYVIRIRKSLSSEEIIFGDLVQSRVKLDKNKGSDTLLVTKGKNQYLFQISLIDSD